uniref:Uncharacterized protein n=1 Tax=Megaselia scalaris TaxID=36166 RepID=T1GM03_MEGSC
MAAVSLEILYSTIAFVSHSITDSRTCWLSWRGKVSTLEECATLSSVVCDGSHRLSLKQAVLLGVHSALISVNNLANHFEKTYKLSSYIQKR